jgi:hypothetical protein
LPYRPVAPPIWSESLAFGTAIWEETFVSSDSPAKGCTAAPDMRPGWSQLKYSRSGYADSLESGEAAYDAALVQLWSLVCVTDIGVSVAVLLKSFGGSVGAAMMVTFCDGSRFSADRVLPGFSYRHPTSFFATFTIPIA